MKISSSLYKQFEQQFIKENPKSSLRKHELRMIENYNKKLKLINKVRSLNSENYNITQIAKILKLDCRTVKKYIDPNFKYDNSRNCVSNLGAFKSLIEHNINKKIKMATIYRIIQEKGYEGSYSNLRSYCRRFRNTDNNDKSVNSKDKIEMKHVIKFLYHPLNKIKEITSKQFDSIFKEYPIIKTIYKVIYDFKAAVFVKKSVNDFSSWLAYVKTLDIPEINSFISGVERDITAVFNAIEKQY